VEGSTVIDFTPTEEQQHCVDLFRSGESVAVQAGAGAAKTSTLELMSRSTQRHGRYLVFNRAAANDAARRFPMSVESSTVHSLAFRQVGRRYAHRLNGGRVQSWELARLMGVDPFLVTVGGRNKMVQPATLASWTIRALKVFCQSADDEPHAGHFPYLEGVDDHPEPGVKGRRNNRGLAREMEPHLRAAWADWCDVDGRLPYDHAAYLKLYSLGDCVVPCDFLMLDEFQDQSPVMLRLAERNQTAGRQLVAVGDENQSVYGFTGAVNGFERLPFACEGWLTQSFRFGPAIADVANRLLAELDTKLRLRGIESIPSRVADATAPRAVLCRTNSGAVERVLQEQQDGRRAHLVGGAAEVVRFAKAVADLQDGRRTYHPELACFESWSQVIEYVEQDPQGDELRLMVKLVQEYGVQIIVDALDGLPAEESADVIVSTAHVSKGREWESVRLHSDFAEPEPGGDAAEWRLAYVAATRARLLLDVGACAPLRLVGVANRAAVPS
jgi:superfamily I DNA/RNA helicase